MNPCTLKAQLPVEIEKRSNNTPVFQVKTRNQHSARLSEQSLLVSIGLHVFADIDFADKTILENWRKMLKVALKVLGD